MNGINNINIQSVQNKVIYYMDQIINIFEEMENFDSYNAFLLKVMPRVNTLKAMAAFLGYKELADIMYKMEILMKFLNKGTYSNVNSILNIIFAKLKQISNLNELKNIHENIPELKKFLSSPLIYADINTENKNVFDTLNQNLKIKKFDLYQLYILTNNLLNLKEELSHSSLNTLNNYVNAFKNISFFSVQDIFKRDFFEEDLNIIIDENMENIVFFHYQAHILIDMFKLIMNKIVDFKDVNVEVVFIDNVFKVNIKKLKGDINKEIISDLKAPNIECIEDDFEKWNIIVNKIPKFINDYSESNILKYEIIKFGIQFHFLKDLEDKTFLEIYIPEYMYDKY